MKKVSQELSDRPALEILGKIYSAASEGKADNPVILDVREISGFADYFVIMSGTSTRHVNGLAEAVDKEIGSKRTKEGNTEGLGESHWVLLDYDDIIIHIFHYEDREYYDLEGLWHDAPRLTLEDLTGEKKDG
jgi:ribosome-associated protein